LNGGVGNSFALYFSLSCSLAFASAGDVITMVPMPMLITIKKNVKYKMLNVECEM